VIAIFDLLYSLKLRQGGEDSIWLSSLRGSSFPWKSIWKVNVPLKVSFFVWTVALGKPDNKKRKKVVEWYCICKSGKSIDHLLLTLYMENEGGILVSLLGHVEPYAIRTSWSNCFIYGLACILFKISLTFLNLWISVILIINGDYLLYTSCVVGYPLHLLMIYISY
jgi:hypothetical protein